MLQESLGLRPEGKRCSVPIGEASLGWMGVMGARAGLGERRTGGKLWRWRTTHAWGWAGMAGIASGVLTSGMGDSRICQSDT